MGEPLRVLCLSPDPTIAAGVAAMFASVPDFPLATRTVGYDEGLHDMREPDLAVVVLEDDPTPGVTVIEGVRRGARSAYVVAVSVDDDPGRDLGMLRQPGHRFFFSVEEVEPLLKMAKESD